MLPELALRILSSTSPRCIGKFLWNFGVKGILSIERFKRRMKKGEFFPPFLYISILNRCNLRCQGCWVDVAADSHQISTDEMGRLITDAKREGNRFFGVGDEAAHLVRGDLV